MNHEKRVKVINIIKDLLSRDQFQTITELSKFCGVSRQTLWRDKEIFSLIRDLNTKKDKSLKNYKQVEFLKEELNKLKAENEFLINKYLNLCKKLQDDGINPNNYIDFDGN